MAHITGSSTIDWSGISLAQVDFETDFVTFVNRVEQIFNDNFSVVSASPTLFVIDIFSGGRLILGGSGFDTLSPIFNSFNFKNPPDGTGEVIRWTGTITSVSEVLTSATIGETGFSETINGNITLFPGDSYSGTVSSLVVNIGSTRATLSGNFSLAGDEINASLSGKVTGISVVSGADTIKMTGLSLSINVIEAALESGDLATVNDLFSVVGNQLAGNDTITYTNNSNVGIDTLRRRGQRHVCPCRRWRERQFRREHRRRYRYDQFGGDVHPARRISEHREPHAHGHRQHRRDWQCDR